MKSRGIVRCLGLWVGIFGLSGGCSPDTDYAARVPAGYDVSYANLVEDGTKEGRLVIWSTTDRKVMRDLLSAFERAYPGITTDYHDLSARDVRDRFLDEEKAENRKRVGWGKGGS